LERIDEMAKFVVVACVPVATLKTNPPVKELVEEAVVAKKFVVVAEVPVAVVKVNLCKVEEARS
jgi:hypothetical protein